MSKPNDGSWPYRRQGFTLIELMAVIVVIAIVCGIALPQLMPAIVFSRAEGAARHLAAYGKSAMAHASLFREAITVKFDLKRGEYWAVLTNPAENFFEGDTTAAQDGKTAPDPTATPQSGVTPLDGSLDLMAGARSAGGGLLAQEPPDPMTERFEHYLRLQLEARAKLVQKDDILAGVGKLFDKPFQLDVSGEMSDEVQDPLLDRSVLPEGVMIDTIRIGASNGTGGEVDVPFSPTGLDEPVLFYVRSDDGDFFTVVWDPITGTSHFGRGQQDFDTGYSQNK